MKMNLCIMTRVEPILGNIIAILPRQSNKATSTSFTEFGSSCSCWTEQHVQHSLCSVQPHCLRVSSGSRSESILHLQTSSIYPSILTDPRRQLTPPISPAAAHLNPVCLTVCVWGHVVAPVAGIHIPRQKDSCSTRPATGSTQHIPNI